MTTQASDTATDTDTAQPSIPLTLVEAPKPRRARTRRPKQQATCAMCGACCSMIALKGSHDGYRFILDRTTPDPDDPADVERRANARFIVEHMKPIHPDIAAKINLRRVLQNPLNHFYLCDWYDVAEKRCIRHEERPPMCRGFPWYGFDQTDPRVYGGLEAYPECSYWADVPRDQWPAFVRPLASPPATPGRAVNVC